MADEAKVRDICALAAIIPEVIDTEKVHLYLLCAERYEIAKAILEKYNVTPKNTQEDAR